MSTYEREGERRSESERGDSGAAAEALRGSLALLLLLR